MNKIEIFTEKERFPVAKNLYGLFFEDINRSGDGGIYPEMLRNRSFEDSIPPVGCTIDDEHQVFVNRGGWPDAFFGGEGMPEWKARVPQTDIPAWYMRGGTIQLKREDTLHDNREAALCVQFEAGGVLKNIGYGATCMQVRVGEVYHFTMFAKSGCKEGVCMDCGFFAEDDTLLAVAPIRKCQEQSEDALRRGYVRYEAELVVDAAAGVSAADGGAVQTAEGMAKVAADIPAYFGITSAIEQTAVIGFTSLMPTDTFCGHGLRKDLCEMLAGTAGKFLRFPGGCIVEGFTKETAMRFPNTIGPVWERPSHHLMWHYRTTNGLGFHEYLQLCEDLQIDAMYVCNCGMSCQARVAEYFDDETVAEILQETLDALEYAMGDTSTKYGALRAAAGHPQPFTVKYLEIGNENWGKEYDKRYEIFYQRLKEAYPDIIYISNAHTERAGLPTEVVDEHYYSSPEWFAEHTTMFESYDREGPQIFLGEYAVNGGETISSMECAIAEAMYLTGVEKNQDIVTLSAYAPLFQNVDYTAWRPNLIVFDQKQVYGIPTYHVLKMLGKNRGEQVVETNEELDTMYPVFHGIPGLMAEKDGVLFRNAKLNGEPIDVSMVVQGAMQTLDGKEFALSPVTGVKRITHQSMLWAEKFEEFHEGRRKAWEANNPDRKRPDFGAMPYVVFGEEQALCAVNPQGSVRKNGKDGFVSYTFEIELKFAKDNPVTLSVWNYKAETDAGVAEPKNFGWSIPGVRRKIWRIENGESYTEMRHPWRKPEEQPQGKPLAIDTAAFHSYKIVTTPEGYDCYIDGECIEHVTLKKYPAIAAAATTAGNDIIIKICNISEEDKEIRIAFDCDIEANGEADVLSAPLDAVNSFAQPENVAAKTVPLAGLGREFTYMAKGTSVNVIRCRKTSIS